MGLKGSIVPRKAGWATLWALGSEDSAVQSNNLSDTAVFLLSPTPLFETQTTVLFCMSLSVFKD